MKWNEMENIQQNQWNIKYLEYRISVIKIQTISEDGI